MYDSTVWKQIFGTLKFSLVELISCGFILLVFGLLVGWSAINSDVYVQQYFTSLQGNLSSFSESYQAVSVEINSNQYVASASVFGFWAIIGLMVYYLLYIILKFEQSFLGFLRRVTPNSKFRAIVLEEALLHMTIRIVGLIVLLLFTNVFVSQLLPYVIVSLNLTIDQLKVTDTYNIALSGLIIAGALHMYVVLLRCIVLRQRLFFGEEMV